MNANATLLQKKYARVVELFAKHNELTLEKALDVFYRSELYKLMSEGVSDMHCMSDEYLVQELEEELDAELVKGVESSNPENPIRRKTP